MIEHKRLGVLTEHKDEETKEQETEFENAFIIFPLAENGDLCDFIENSGPLDESDACGCAK